ncbi:hypothetical protein AAMO2058_001668300 [Amorphochlora amoebiformis]
MAAWTSHRFGRVYACLALVYLTILCSNDLKNPGIFSKFQNFPRNLRQSSMNSKKAAFNPYGLGKGEGSYVCDVTVSWVGNGVFKVPIGNKTTISIFKKKLSRISDVPLERVDITGFREINDICPWEDDDFMTEAHEMNSWIYLQGMCRAESNEFEYQYLLAGGNATDWEKDIPKSALSDPEFKNLLTKEPYKSKFEFRKKRVTFGWLHRPRKGVKCLVLDLDHTLIDIGPSDNVTCFYYPNGSNPEISSELDQMSSDEFENIPIGELEIRFSLRPGLYRFLAKVYPKYDIILWSGGYLGWMMNKTIDAQFLNSPNFKITAVLDFRSHIIINSAKYGTFTTKPLQYIWDNSEGCYDESNTILVDDYRKNAVLNSKSLLWEYLLAITAIREYDTFSHTRYERMRANNQYREQLERDRRKEEERLREQASKKREAIEVRIQNEAKREENEKAILRKANMTSTEASEPSEDSEERVRRKQKELLQPYDPLEDVRKAEEASRKVMLKVGDGARVGGFGKESQGLPATFGGLFWEDAYEEDEEIMAKLRKTIPPSPMPSSKPKLFATRKGLKSRRRTPSPTPLPTEKFEFSDDVSTKSESSEVSRERDDYSKIHQASAYPAEELVDSRLVVPIPGHEDKSILKENQRLDQERFKEFLKSDIARQANRIAREENQKSLEQKKASEGKSKMEIIYDRLKGSDTDNGE